jgi:superfamily II RNA helicase
LTLGDRIARGASADETLDAFLGWVSDQGLSPYPEQEEAILELLADRHVVLSTPTGSGKSLVALALHFRALCKDERSFYTAPVKALVSEKFFALCDEFGADRVGMLTGDASINPDAPVICCTTEVLANMALRGGEATDAPCVVLDEFHYYDDRDRGMAWQLPLLLLRHSQFLLMSATLGNTASIEERLAAFTARDVAHVHSDVRPVPLDFEYRETPLHETLEDLVGRDLAPVYVVNFTQRECGELAQGATSAKLVSRETRAAIADEIADFRFDTAYGRDVKRFLSHGIGVHHAGLLPKYRLLVEQLAQKGLLRVIFGTDTLGVGVNVPIRTVVLNRLSKYDGEKVGILGAREFHQIAGRAGRKGFDDRGEVACQAPDHVIENKRLERKAREGSGKRKAKKKPPPDFVPWTKDTFEQLVHKPPEMLRSQFAVSHGLILSVLQRESGADYGAVIRLVNGSHESEVSKARQRRRAAALFRSLVAAGVLVLARGRDGEREIRVSPDLQADFSLHDTISLYVVEAAAALDPGSDTYALEILSLIEAVQENPRPILREQTRRAKGEMVAKWKAEGVEYEERMRRLEEVTYPKPEEDFLRETFRLFAERYPWAREEDVRPKSIARDLVERYVGFREYVKELGLAHSEGLLLRYLSQVHNTLVKTLPDAAKTDEVYEVIAFLRVTLSDVDTSLLEAWEDLSSPRPERAATAEPTPAPRFDLAQQPRLLTARVRSELLSLVRALASRDYEEATRWLAPEADAPWDAARIEEALAPFHSEYGDVRFTPEARRAHHTRLASRGPREWEVSQVLLDSAGDNLWALHGEVDLRRERDPDAPLVHLVRIGM